MQAKHKNNEAVEEILETYRKLLIESNLDFSNIFNSKTNRESFLENPSSEVIKYLEAIRGCAIAQKLKSKEIPLRVFI